ncbi:MAG: hypothetical protein R3E32_19055 [Chitinophagales bacterium]
MITKKQVLKAQKNWGNAIVEIGRLRKNRSACEEAANSAINTLYAFDTVKVLFKPTKASDIPFRLTKEGAISYFIGSNVQYPEDKGFALQPWMKVRFDNAAIILKERRAFAVGNYYFMDATGNEIKVEYTFSYIQNEKGDLQIEVHHSSFPYAN